MADAADAVYARWVAAPLDEDEPDLVGVQTEPATAAALDAFEARHRVKLPSAFRALYQLSDGTSEMDGHENIFWPLAAMSAQLNSFDIEDPVARWIGFADFRLQTAVFYLRIDAADGADSVWVDTSEPGRSLPERLEQIAGSLEDFLTRYAQQPLFWRAKKADG